MSTSERKFNTCPAVDELVDGFSPVTLEQLNSKAEMLSRIDNKYVIRREHLLDLVSDLADDFDILEIDNRRSFVYKTRYYDDASKSAYYEHHQGLRKGFKVRVRRYVDADLCFLEVKVKGKRGQTIKTRLPYDPDNIEFLTPQALEFAQRTYFEHYKIPFRYELLRALDLRYERVTLVAKTGGERLTIDSGMHFSALDRIANTDPDVFIIETKSKLGRGTADLSLRQAGVRPTGKCSKYCIGMAALNQVSRWNRFLPTMRQLGLATINSAVGHLSLAKVA